jgi:predicted HTH domain antitoxin
MGVHRYGKDLTLYCTDDCANTPMSKYPETEVRDEVACELYLQGNTLVEVAQAVGLASHQHLAQILQRRGVTSSVREAKSA